MIIQNLYSITVEKLVELIDICSNQMKEVIIYTIQHILLSNQNLVLFLFHQMINSLTAFIFLTKQLFYSIKLFSLMGSTYLIESL